MPAPAHKSAARVFASACLVVSGLGLGTLTGCESDSERADKSVLKSVQAAQGEHGEAAVAALQKASQQSAASPGATAHAKAVLAQAEVDQARKVLVDVEKNELAVARLASEITDIAGQVARNNAVIAGYLEFSPKATGNVAKLLETEAGQVKGSGGEAVWSIGDAGKLPALSNLAAASEKLAPQIKDLETKKADLSKQRADTDAKAAELMQQSKRKTGQASVDLFVQSTELTKKAADLANQIGVVDHQLTAVQQDAAVVAAQSEHLQEAVKGIDSKVAANQKVGEDLKTLIEAHRALSNALVYGQAGVPTKGDKGDTATPPAGASAVEKNDRAVPAAFQAEAATEPAPAAAPAEENTAAAEGVPTPVAEGAGEPAAPAKPAAPSTVVTNVSMDAKAKEMIALLTDTAGKRQKAIDLLKSALGHYDAAIADGQKLRSELQKNISNPDLRTVPQQSAWKTLADLNGPAKMNLQKALAQHTLAAVYRDAVATLAVRKQMLTVTQPILEEAGILLPPDLQEPKIEQLIDEQKIAANEAYDAAQKSLQEDVIDKAGSEPSEQAARNAAQVALVSAMYGRAQLARSLNDADGAEKLLTGAKQSISSGAMPAEDYPGYIRMALGLAAPSTQPAAPAAAETQPSGETQPAEGAPATAPAAQ